jgi:S-(hydroxymethyl)glutathione dehydrogenase/alcohol dehydrogenase
VKAAVLTKQNSPLKLMDLMLPPKLAPGQVIVKVEYSAICGKQINEINGNEGPDKYLPHLLGHEGSGFVFEVGPGVTKVKPGDYVVLHWRKGSGIDAKPPKYKDMNSDMVIGAGPIATFADMAVISENRMTKIPFYFENRLDEACLLGCGVTTGLGLINNEAKLKIGQSILIIGCGGVGLNVIQGAKMVSAGFIAVSDINEDRLKKAECFGADCLIDNVLHVDSSFNVVVDCTGNPEIISHAFGLVLPGGKLVLVGQPIDGLPVTFPYMNQHYKGKMLMDSQGGLTNPDKDIPRYINLAYMDRLNLKDQIAKVFPLNDINLAIEAHSKVAGKVLVRMA